MFRAQDWAQAGRLFRATLVPSFSHAALLPTDLYVSHHRSGVAYFALARLEERLEPDRSVLTAIPLELRYLCYAGIAYFTLFRSAEPQSFIYFQF